MGFSDLHRLSTAGTAFNNLPCVDHASSQIQAGSDHHFIADYHAMAESRKSLFAEYAKPVGDDVAKQTYSQAHTQLLVDEVAKYGRRIAATRAVTNVGLQNKRAIVGMLLAEMTDDPSPVCDQLLLSLLNDSDRVCAHAATPLSTVNLQEHPDGHLIETCKVSLEQIEKVCMECIRVGALPMSKEQEQLTMLLMSLLMSTRKLLADTAGMAASSFVGVQMKGNLLRRMMTIGEADVHHERLVLAQSFVADLATVGPHSDAEVEIADSGPHWWTNLANRILRLKGATTSP